MGCIGGQQGRVFQKSAVGFKKAFPERGGLFGSLPFLRGAKGRLPPGSLSAGGLFPGWQLSGSRSVRSLPEKDRRKQSLLRRGGLRAAGKEQGKEFSCFSGVAGFRSGGDPVGLVHVNGNGFMDGIVLVRQIGIVFIIRIEVFQLSAENGNLDQTCLPVSGKEDAIRV